MTRGEHVLDAVLTVLAQQGIGALSVRTVAAAAGVSPAQVQYYYRSKSDLVRAAYEYAADQFVADLEAADAATLHDILLLWLPLDERRERRARVWLAYAATAAVDPELGAEAASVDADLRARLAEADLTAEQAAQLLALLDGVTLHCLVLPMAERQALVERTVAPFLATLTDEGRPAG